MMVYLRALGSIKFALIGFGILFVAIFIRGLYPEVDQWLILPPLGILSVNLLLAVMLNIKIRQNLALSLFHLCVLALVILSAYAQLVRFTGQVELAKGQALDAASIEPLSYGLWYQSKIEKMDIMQGTLEVNYAPELYRQRTHSNLVIHDQAGGQREMTVGDDIPLAIDGYRFYTTPNKGFSAIVSWIDKVSGEVTTGAINFPSFPAKEWAQKQQWITPGGAEISINLKANIVSDTNQAWKLSSDDIDAELEVIINDQVFSLVSGSELELPNGSLKLEQIGLWMGYKVIYDPTLRWMFLIAVFGIGTMAWYLHQRTSAKTAPLLSGLLDV